MAVISAAGLCLFIFIIIKVYPSQSNIIKVFYFPALGLKIISGISLGLIYTYYYSVGDTFGFFDDALKVAALSHGHISDYLNFLLVGNNQSPIVSELINTQERSLFLVKILSVVSLFSFSNYWIASFYLSAASFLGSWYLFTKISLIDKDAIVSSAISFLLLPSFLFWSSGIIKESLAAGSIMFLSGAFLFMIKKQKLHYWEWIVGLISAVILWNLKYYWAVLFIPAAITSLVVIRFISPWIPDRFRAAETLIWTLVFLSMILLASTIHPNFYLSRVLQVVVENHDAYVIVSGDKPFVEFNLLEPTWKSVLMNSPWALFSGLFRPFIFEASTLFQGIVGLENMLLLLLTIYNLRYLSLFWNSDERHMIFGLMVYISLLAIFLTLSTPNFGTLSRYRVGFLPFYFFLLLYYPIKNFKPLKLT